MATYKKRINNRVERAKELFNKLKGHGVTFEIFESEVITSWATSDGYNTGGIERRDITPPDKVFRMGNKWPIEYTINNMEKLLYHIHEHEKWLLEKNVNNEFLEYVKSNI